MSRIGRPPLLAGKEEEVVAMYLGGATIVDIQERFGVSDTPIIRILDAAGVQRRIGRPPGRPGNRAKRPPAQSSAKRVDSPKVRVPSTGPRASKSVQDEVFRRDGYRCRRCGSRERLTVEYTIPPSRGGSAKNPSDLRTVCAECSTNPVDKRGFLRRIFDRR